MEWETVVVTGANGQGGRRLLSSLQGQYQKVIALVRTPTDLSATEVISDWIHSSQAQAAIAQADAIVHLAGNLKPDRDDYISANVKPTESLVSALNSTRTKRIVFLSYVGTSLDSSNAYLSTKAQAETILQTCHIPLTLFRSTGWLASPSRTHGRASLEPER